jgi:hypothetical protein
MSGETKFILPTYCYHPSLVIRIRVAATIFAEELPSHNDQ